MDPTCAMNQEPYDVNFSALKEHPHHWHVVRLLVSTDIALYLMPLPPKPNLFNPICVSAL